MLHFSSGESTPMPRFRRAPRWRSGFDINGELAVYADSIAAIGTAPRRRAGSSRARFADAAKRCLDIVGALAMLALSFPIFLIVAILVRASSPGPVLFRQKRLGKHGELFTCFKFRTMVKDAESQLASHAELRDIYTREFKIKNDPRITKVGNILRKTSLDELPQLLNVLQGTMSLVGPRPIVPVEISKYGSFGDKLLSVRPGLTGVWQVCGRSDTTYDQRIVMDMFYVDRSSVGMDIKLLCSTIPSVIKRRGAY